MIEVVGAAVKATIAQKKAMEMTMLGVTRWIMTHMGSDGVREIATLDGQDYESSRRRRLHDPDLHDPQVLRCLTCACEAGTAGRHPSCVKKPQTQNLILSIKARRGIQSRTLQGREHIGAVISFLEFRVQGSGFGL